MAYVQVKCMHVHTHSLGSRHSALPVVTIQIHAEGKVGCGHLILTLVHEHRATQEMQDISRSTLGICHVPYTLRKETPDIL